MSAKILIVSDVWSDEEERQRLTFTGGSGYEFNRMLAEAGIQRSECELTAVFQLRPRPTIDVENLCVAKSQVLHTLPAIRPGKYIRDEYLPELARLKLEIASLNPNLIIAMGNTAAWALMDDPRIGKIRGTTSVCNTGHKILPTYHPTSIQRQWDLRHVTVLDLMKAKREAEFPEVRRPQRKILVPETVEELEPLYDKYIAPAKRLAFDIETAASQITCIGFAPSIDLALVVPIWDNRRGRSYWTTCQDELQAWRFIRRVLDSRVPKVGQNTIYDITYLWQRYGIPVRNYTDDTMLMHHALQPESEKGLGFLGSVYCDEPAWKQMRKHGTTIKKEE